MNLEPAIDAIRISLKLLKSEFKKVNNEKLKENTKCRRNSKKPFPFFSVILPNELRD